MFIFDRQARAFRLPDAPPLEASQDITVLCWQCGQPVEPFQAALQKTFCRRCEFDRDTLLDIGQRARPVEARDHYRQKRQEAMDLLTAALERLLFGK